MERLSAALLRDESVEKRAELGNFLQMSVRQFSEARRTLTGERDANDATVDGVAVALHQPQCFRPIGELTSRVVPHHQVLRNLLDGGRLMAVMAAHGQQQLVLARREASRGGLI